MELSVCLAQAFLSKTVAAIDTKLGEKVRIVSERKDDTSQGSLKTSCGAV